MRPTACGVASHPLAPAISEESLLGTERVSYRNRYEGTLSPGEITFTLDSDRPWGFPRQSFVMERPDAP